MLGFKHIIYILITFSITILLDILIKKGKINFDKFLKISAVITLTLDPMYWIWEYVNFNKFNFETTLPLYICSLFWMLLPIVAFSKKKGLIYKISLVSLSTIVFYGGILGLVLNSHLNNYPFSHFIVQRSLFYHAMMMWVSILIWRTSYYQVEKNDKFLFPIPLLILMIPAYILDKKYGYDYCYFNGGPDSILKYLSDNLGVPLFLIVLYGLLFTTIYLILDLLYKKRIKNK